jgi:hypothetical protein
MGRSPSARRAACPSAGWTLRRCSGGGEVMRSHHRAPFWPWRVSTAVHGDKFRLKSPPEPERQITWSFNQAIARLSAWTGRHFKDLPALVGTVVRVEFLTASGEAMYRRPLLAIGI